jgi:deoxyribonuclease-4
MKKKLVPAAEMKPLSIKLGAHLSVAGGLDRALLKAEAFGFNTVALFVRNQRRWQSRPLTEKQVKLFHTTREKTGLSPVIAHSSYLINLAGEKEIRDKSISAMLDELERCIKLGIEYYVFHPGSNPHMGKGMELIAETLCQILLKLDKRERHPVILLETTAGQGNSIGYRFEQLAFILKKLEEKTRQKQTKHFGICLDTAHIFAAGYDIREAGVYKKTMEEFHKILGIEKLRVIHLNDSKKPLDSRVDRHEHIGLGQIGLSGFRRIIKDSRFKNIPFILETPKGKDKKSGKEWDEINAGIIGKLSFS